MHVHDQIRKTCGGRGRVDLSDSPFGAGDGRTGPLNRYGEERRMRAPASALVVGGGIAGASITRALVARGVRVTRASPRL